MDKDVIGADCDLRGPRVRDLEQRHLTYLVNIAMLVRILVSAEVLSEAKQRGLFDTGVVHFPCHD